MYTNVRKLPRQSLGDIWFKFRALTFQYMLKDRRPLHLLATAPRPWHCVVSWDQGASNIHKPISCLSSPTVASSSTSWQPSRFRHSNAGSDGSAFSVVLVMERQKDASISRMLAPPIETAWLLIWLICIRATKMCENPQWIITCGSLLW